MTLSFHGAIRATASTGGSPLLLVLDHLVRYRTEDQHENGTHNDRSEIIL